MSQQHARRRSSTLAIDTASILMDLRRHWWNILLMLFAGGLLAFSLSGGMIRPTFQSNAVLAVIGNAGSSVSNVQSASRMSSAITSVIDSDVFRQLISEKVGTSSYTLSARYIEDTNLISITSTSGSARLAFQVLQAALSDYPALLSDLMSDLYMVTVQPPKVPVQPLSTLPLWYLTASGAAAGGAGYAVLVVLLSILRDTVKNGSDMRHKIDGKLLGTVPFFPVGQSESNKLILARRAGTDPRYEESYQLIVTRIMTSMSQDQSKTLAITSVTPNEGKTHALLNIAYAISKTQKKVLVIDADFRSPSLYNLFPESGNKDSELDTAIQHKKVEPDRLYQIPGTEVYCLFNQNRNASLNRSLSNGNFAALLQDAGKQFDYVLVDTGPVALVADTLVIAAQCDASMMIVAQDAASIRAINDTIDALDRESDFLGCIYRETRPGRRRLTRGYNPYAFGKVKN